MTKIAVNIDPREEKKIIAAEIKDRLKKSGVLAVNLVSSPGSGKTTLLEHALPLLSKQVRLAVIEADCATRNDADRLEAAGIKVEMIATSITGCHISPAASKKAFDALDIENLDVVLIENVGNLVCPSDVDIGEDYKIVMVSAAEGEDKPLKYPLIFMNAQLALINKIDIAEALEADIYLLEKNIRAVNPGIEVIKISAKKEMNIDKFNRWIINKLNIKRQNMEEK
jgi:hydrogenase nickel incorporation protein HypB